MNPRNKLIDDFYTFTQSNTVDNLNNWVFLVIRQLELWGWNKKSIDDFVTWGDDGFNNFNLHIENSLEDFYDEVEYCCDRMSLDRLFRCHVIFQNLKRR